MSKEISKEKINNDEQMYAALTFAFILIIVGMPLWWHTTQVYRVALPYSVMDSLRPEVVPAISTRLFVSARDPSKAEKIANDIKSHFLKSEIFDAAVSTEVVPEVIFSKSIHEERDIEDILMGVVPQGGVKILELPRLEEFTKLPVLLGQNSTLFFSKDADSLSVISMLETRILQEEELTTRLLRTWTHRSPSAKHFAPEPAYDVLITVLHPQPGSASVHFDVSKSIQEYLMPFVKELHGVCDLRVKSQWLHLVDLRPDPAPQQRPGSNYYVLPYNALPHLITPLEKKLGSHVTARPVINLVVWAPSCEISPLHIEDANGTRLLHDAFVSPRWGGIQIVNPKEESCDITVEGGRVMKIFVEQLRVLLGLPSAVSQVSLVTPSSLPLRQWERDALVRRRTLEFVSSAKHTLKSLSELLGKISNIVINDKVGTNIFDALENVDACESALVAGDLRRAHAAAVAAHTYAETAFTDPSLLALLYFPEDQKYAVYIPLFLPVMIPVLISFKPMREWMSLKIAARKAKTD